MYDEPNINNFYPEIDVDALREYAEKVSQIDEKTPLKTALSICGVHGQNPDPKLVEYQLPEKPVIQDEFSFIPDSTVTNVLNNPVFESQSATKEVVHLNLEDTTNGSTTTFSPYDEIRKRLENLSDKQKALIENHIKQTGDWSSTTKLAIDLIANSPTGASAITKFDTETTTGIYMNESNGININSGPTLEVDAITRGGKGSGQPTAKPSNETIIADAIQELLNNLNLKSATSAVEYHLRQALRYAKNQTLDPTLNQPNGWNFIGYTYTVGKNAVLISPDGFEQYVLFCYNERTLLIVGNKLVRMRNPEEYSKTVWKYINQCIDKHYKCFWVYDKDIRPMSHAERKRHLIDFFNHNSYRNGWS